jgi:glycosyltransferase involved in cell wall biosynthesis
MRIGIDYTAAVKQGGGIGRYTRHLVRALSAVTAKHSLRLFVAGGWGQGDGQGAWPNHVSIRSVPISDRWLSILWQRLRLPVPIQVVTGGLDLFHSPDFVLPPVGRTPAILTVHDLSFLRVPQFFVSGFCEYLSQAVARAVDRAHQILADSESTKRDLVELMAVSPERIHVVYPGVEERFRPVVDQPVLDSVRQRYRLPERFVLGLSTLQPRKNFDGLVAAFGRMLQEYRGEPALDDLDLVIAGGKGWMVEDLQKQVADAGLLERMHFCGYVRDQDLPALYTLASVFAFPSWYEGFGIPVVEAMACGTPVVSADNSSLPEAAGDAGLLVDAGDVGGWAEAMWRLVADEELRGPLIDAGREQAKRFRWEKAASQVLQVYEQFA